MFLVFRRNFTRKSQPLPNRSLPRIVVFTDSTLGVLYPNLAIQSIVAAPIIPSTFTNLNNVQMCTRNRQLDLITLLLHPILTSSHLFLSCLPRLRTIIAAFFLVSCRSLSYDVCFLEPTIFRPLSVFLYFRTDTEIELYATHTKVLICPTRFFNLT